jgi:tRNA-binding EMAP/Myf-like protein
MAPAPIKPTIPLDILNQIDIRVGTIESVSDIAGSDKLVALRIRFGDHACTIVAGLQQERSNPAKSRGVASALRCQRSSST